MRTASKLLVACSIVFFGGCTHAVQGSGRMVSRSFDFSGFDQIEAGAMFKLLVARSDSYSVSVNIDDNLVGLLDITQRGSTLKIHVKPWRNIQTSKDSPQVRIAMPGLTRLELRGAASAKITGFKALENLELDGSGASRIEGELTARNLELGLSGASQVELTGSAHSLELDASGASEAELRSFSVSNRADVQLSGASEADVWVTGELAADLSGASNLRYAGNPLLKSLNTSGISSARSR